MNFRYCFGGFLIVILLSSCYVATQSHSARRDSVMDERLIGRWELRSIEVDGRLLQVDTGRYFLNVSEKGIGYNLEVNNCSLSGWIVKNNTITAESTPCTRVCCDERSGTTYKYLNYTGTYELADSDNTLIIINDSGIFRLKKSW